MDALGPVLTTTDYTIEMQDRPDAARYSVRTPLAYVARGCLFYRHPYKPDTIVHRPLTSLHRFDITIPQEAE